MKKFKLLKVARYYCEYCKTQKDTAAPLLDCPNCGATLTRIKIEDVRRTFPVDNREVNPL